MLPFGVTIRATVPQRSEIPEGLMNDPVYDTTECLATGQRRVTPPCAAAGELRALLPALRRKNPSVRHMK